MLAMWNLALHAMFAKGIRQTVCNLALFKCNNDNNKFHHELVTIPMEYNNLENQKDSQNTQIVLEPHFPTYVM